MTLDVAMSQKMTEHSRLKIPFVFKGKHGSISVEISENRGIKSSGFTAIGHKFKDGDVKGYPTMKASVSYTGRGYEALFGWVQIVTHTYDGGPEIEAVVDIASQFSEYSNPFCFYGYKPTIFDAPRHNPGVTMNWIAYTFLCPLKFESDKGTKVIALVTD